MKPDICDEVVRLLTPPPAPKEGRGRLVWTAIGLFYRHGINAIGLDRNADGGEYIPGSLYVECVTTSS